MTEIKIHIVEDDLEQQDTLRHVVEQDKRYTAILSDSAQAAILKHEEGAEPALVICDVNLEEANSGYTVVADCKTRKIPAIVVTGRDTQEQDERVSAIHGAVQYMRKPVDPLRLMRTIENLLSATGVLVEAKDLGDGVSYITDTGELMVEGKVAIVFGNSNKRLMDRLVAEFPGYVHREDLIVAVYGMQDFGLDRNIYGLIDGVRKKLKENNTPVVIDAGRARSSRGFRLKLEDDE